MGGVCVCGGGGLSPLSVRQIVMCASCGSQMATFGDLKTLADQLGADNLTPDLGGNLPYDHSVWVSNRLVCIVYNNT